MQVPIKIDTEIFRSHITGRNGYYKIKQIGFQTLSDDRVRIAGYGISGQELNAGVVFTGKAMDELCDFWQKVRAHDCGGSCHICQP